MDNIEPSAYKKETRMARKEHKCCECRGIICPKQTYHYCSGIWEGRPDSFKVCFACQEIRKELEWRIFSTEPIPFEKLQDAVLEWANDMPHLLREFVDHARCVGGKIDQQLIEKEKKTRTN